MCRFVTATALAAALHGQPRTFKKPLKCLRTRVWNQACTLLCCCASATQSSFATKLLLGSSSAAAAECCECARLCRWLNHLTPAAQCVISSCPCNGHPFELSWALQQISVQQLQAALHPLQDTRAPCI